MSNYGELRPGMKFGNYEPTKKALEEKYREEEKLNSHGDNSVFYDQNGKQKGRARRDYAPREGFPVSGSISMGSYTWSATKLAEKKGDAINKFDCIEGNDEHAVDLNRNGVVDENEIFKGELDQNAYLDAKTNGKIGQYTQNRYNNMRDAGWNGVE